MKKISRRSFLKVSGTMAAAGALAACGGSSSTSTAASSEAAPSVEAKALKANEHSAKLTDKEIDRRLTNYFRSEEHTSELQSHA